MGKNPLIGIIKEELENETFNPVRNAKMRITSNANGMFRMYVEKLLQRVNTGEITELDALKKIVVADGVFKNYLMEAHEIVEKHAGYTGKGNAMEQKKYLADKYGTYNWKDLNETMYANILARSNPSFEETISDAESNEEDLFNSDIEPEVVVDKPKKAIDYNALDKSLSDLDKFVGLTKVKNMIHQQVDLLKYNSIMKERGLPTQFVSLHMALLGNPGTGKTTVAKKIAQIYKNMGVLSKGNFVSVQRSDLIGQYVGHSEKKAEELFESALGGVLFIDEAYSLAPEGADGGGDFGGRVIEILLTVMEKHRDDFVVIIAGYTREMQRFFDSNSGLKSRFSNILEFDDYTEEELYTICKTMIDNNRLNINDEDEELLHKFFCWLYKNRGENFGNGRDIRNIVEKIKLKFTSRVMMTVNKEDLDNKVLTTILPIDICNAISESYPLFSSSEDERSDE